MAIYRKRYPGTMVLAFMLAFLYVGISAPAFAAEPDFNLCDTIFNKIPAGAKEYVIKGVVPRGFKPAHSRAWYATALGMTPQLEKFLSKDPSLVNNQTLLLAAVGTPYSSSIRVFLSHGANPNAYLHTARVEGWPLLALAANCRRPVNMLYLLKAGADIYAYETHDAAKVNAMGVSAMSGDTGPFRQGIILLLAAGYDPRCLAAKDSTALAILKRELPGPEEVSKTLKTAPKGLKFLHTKQEREAYKSRIKAFIDSVKHTNDAIAVLKGALAIAKMHSPGLPRCGSNKISSVENK